MLSNNKQDAVTVDELDISKYVGRWYQVYAGRLSFVATEGSGSCIAADYGIVSTNNISVLNQEIASNGNRQTISGYAYVPDASEPAQLIVVFPFSSGDYWVVKLGPDTYGENGLYQYSVVTDKHKTQLYVLARDVATFQSEYDAEVTEYLSSNGFTYYWNTPIATNQDNCTYLDVTSNQKTNYLRGQ